MQLRAAGFFIESDSQLWAAQ